MDKASVDRLLFTAAQEMRRRQFTLAESMIAGVLTTDPRNVRALCLKALIAAETARPELAVKTIERAVKEAPRMPEVLNDAACVYSMCNQIPRAIELWRWVATLTPQPAKMYFNMGVSHLRLNEPDKAEECFRKVIASDPNDPDAYLNLSNVVKDAGRIEDALIVAREGVRRHPNDARHWGSLLYALHFAPNSTPEEIVRECAEWGRQFEAAIPAFDRHEHDRTPNRKLRIGYLSPNFRDHSETYFILPLFRGTDRSACETWAYSCNGGDDEMTPRIRELTDLWRDVASLDDEQLARQIREDRIDILVDLTMHMDGSRLGVFARRAAPVQVAWLAYPSTTGLTRMDYTILDPHIEPSADKRSAERYTERPFILPDCYWCYEVYGPKPDVSPLPADTNGFITFGSLNHYGKVTRDTLEAWAQILARVERSRLLLHVGSKGAAETARAFFVSKGIAKERIECQLRVPREAYMRSYHRMDIAFDPFPYNGATTTCDALWMGVPVISRAGPTAVSRAGLSILANMGLPELVATQSGDEGWSEYTAIAQNLAADLPRLRTLRQTLRRTIEQSKVMDAEAFGKDMTKAYRTMWERWCQQ